MINKLLCFLFFALILSCGKDDKNSEYISEDKEQQNQQKNSDSINKNQEQKTKDTAQLKQENPSQNNSSKSKEKTDFQTEKPVAVISPLDAEEYNGRTVTVKGFVADVFKSEKVAYLNFVAKYPDNPFTAVIFASKFNDFPEIEKYENKNVEVTGKVSIFKGKPQIILNNPSQIKY